MSIWQADFYRRPLQDASGQVLWELLICDVERTFEFIALCPQSQVKVDWVVAQLQVAAGGELPSLIQVFRPQSLSLITTAAEQLGIVVEPNRRTYALKELLLERSHLYPDMAPLALDKPPPMPLPEMLWGEQWRFAALDAIALSSFQERPIPIIYLPEFLLPLNLGLASSVAVPGVVIDGGRQSLRLARWLEQSRPVALNYVAGAPDGLILEAGLVDRWIVATFADLDVAAAANVYEQRKQQSQGLHFLLVQPDDSGMTYSGFWLLRQDDN